MKTQNIHSPKNFVPTDYIIVDYFDKHKPTFCGSHPDAAIAFKEAMEAYKKERYRLFGDRSNLICDHCGQQNVMLVVACDHIPSKKRVCIGWQCANKIGLPLDQYKKKFLLQYRKSRESQLLLAQMRGEFRDAHTDIIPWLETFKTSNNFVCDLQEKFQKNGKLTDLQIEALKVTKKREEEYQVKKLAHEADLKHAPKVLEGKHEVEGTIISTKLVESPGFGFRSEPIRTWKMIVELTDKNRVYVTIPVTIMLQSIAQHIELKGLKVKFTATFTRSKDDDHFAFGKHPTRAILL